MKCPHCLTTFHDQWKEFYLNEDKDGFWSVFICTCPACNRMVVNLARGAGIQALPDNKGKRISSIEMRRVVHPKVASRTPPSQYVPEVYAKDYLEACLVLSDSPKASAALSRRCLQALLRDVVGVKPGSLDKEIQQVIDSGKFPSHISEDLDAVRTIGNFAAHPLKSQSSGEIIEVEPGEAEWTLDVLESLFDFLFVHPEVAREKRKALNAKLEEAGKPPLKSPAKAEEESDA